MRCFDGEIGQRKDGVNYKTEIHVVLHLGYAIFMQPWMTNTMRFMVFVISCDWMLPIRKAIFFRNEHTNVQFLSATNNLKLDNSAILPVNWPSVDKCNDSQYELTDLYVISMVIKAAKLSRKYCLVHTSFFIHNQVRWSNRCKSSLTTSDAEVQNFPSVHIEIFRFFLCRTWLSKCFILFSSSNHNISALTGLLIESPYCWIERTFRQHISISD